MGRKGTNTLGNTSIPKILAGLIDSVIAKDYKQDSISPRRKSRAQVMTEAMELYVYLNDDLEEFLKSHDYPAEVISNIMERLKREYGTSKNKKKIQ